MGIKKGPISNSDLIEPGDTNKYFTPDVEAALQAQILAVNGAPKSVFATAAALATDATANTADGKKYIYLVEADGKWYYWDGVAWAAGAVYQETPIADSSIGLDKTVAKKALTYEYGDIDSTGADQVSTTAKRTALFVVEKGAVLKLGGIWNSRIKIKHYADSYTFVSGEVLNNSSQKVFPASALIRLVLYNTSADAVELENEPDYVSLFSNSKYYDGGFVADNSIIYSNLLDVEKGFDFAKSALGLDADKMLNVSFSRGTISVENTIPTYGFQYYAFISDYIIPTSTLKIINSGYETYDFTVWRYLLDGTYVDNSYYVTTNIYTVAYDTRYKYRISFRDSSAKIANAKVVSDNLTILDGRSKILNNPKHDLDCVTVSYHRDVASNTSYILTRIGNKAPDGRTIKASVRITPTTISATNKISALSYSATHDHLVIINAGIFYNNLAEGTIISKGEILLDGVISDFPAQYTLGIKTDGTLLSYEDSVTAETILADGCSNAVTGFVPIIDNYEILSDTIINICPHATEAHPRQVIAQMYNGDYLIFTCEGRVTGETGMTLADCARILKAINVRFAYNLDGGGSTETIQYKRQINNIIEPPKGRPVPTVITFDVAE